MSVNVICELVEEDKPSIRAALMRTGAVSVLAHHSNQVKAVRALLSLAKYKYTHSDICNHLEAILDRTLTPDPIHLLCTYAVGVLHRCLPAILVRLTNGRRLYATMVARLLCLTHMQPSAHVLLERTLRTRPNENVDAIVVASPLFNIYSPQEVAFYNVVARRCPHATAKRFGKYLIRDVCRDAAPCMLETLRLCMNYLEEDVFCSDMIDCILDSTKPMVSCTMAQVFFRCAQTDASAVRVAASHTRWGAFVTYLRETTETNKTIGSLSPALLLQIALHQGLDEASQAYLREHLLQFPHRFSFTATENIDALRSIVDVAIELNLPLPMYRQYLTSIEDHEAALRQHKRLAELHLDDIVPPDAFQCPITMEPMKDPVVASDGHTYERSSLQRILDMSDHRSPLTRELLDRRTMIPNINLKKRIRDYADEICSIAEKAQKMYRRS